MSDFTSTKGVLTHEELREVAPSIFTHQKREGLTERYNLVPTFAVVQEMEALGWLPVKAGEERCRNEMGEGYQKHLIRFRNFDENQIEQLKVGDSLIEAVLTNSHNGLASFVFNLGVFRLRCMNGMVIPEGMFQSIHIRHNSYDATRIVEVCRQIIGETPKVGVAIDEMRAIPLTQEEEHAFAKAAAALRFDDPVQVNLRDVTRSRRIEDDGRDLWKVFNRTQENIIKGGVRMNGQDRYNRPKSRRAREIKSINNNIKLNQALWTLAEEMKRLKNEGTV